eukprot:15078530-Alexandrium_andersonii.AAC.1
MEYALDDAPQACHIAQLRHVPGVLNARASALLRQSAPEPKPFPAKLASAPRSIVPIRSPGHYH